MCTSELPVSIPCIVEEDRTRSVCGFLVSPDDQLAGKATAPAILFHVEKFSTLPLPDLLWLTPNFNPNVFLYYRNTKTAFYMESSAKVN